MCGRGSVAIDLGVEERDFQEARLHRHKAARPLSDRCRIVLRCADGPKSKAAAAEPGHSEHGVGKWRRRFAECRIEGLSDEYRAGRPSASWINQEERRLAELTRKRLQRASCLIPRFDGARGGSGDLDRRDKWIFCSTAA